MWAGGGHGDQTLSILLMSHVEMATLHILWFGDGEKSRVFNPCQSSPSNRKQDPSLPCPCECRLTRVTGSQKPPLLCLATASTLAEEWLPSNLADILQIVHNGTFQSSSRYFGRAFLSRNPKCFSRLSPGGWEVEEAAAHESCFPGGREMGPDPWFPALHRGYWWPGLFESVSACVKP